LHNGANKDKLVGKSFVFTGTLEQFSRIQAQDIIRSLGGSIHTSTTKMTSYVVTGANPGSKVEKAKKLGVTILTEKEFLDMVEMTS
jgi:DNA ligase (NAD+)